MGKKIEEYTAKERIIFVVFETATLKTLSGNGKTTKEILPEKTLKDIGLDSVDTINIMYILENRFGIQDKYINIFGWVSESVDHIIQSLKKAKFHNLIRPSKLTKEEKTRFISYSDKKKFAELISS